VLVMTWRTAMVKVTEPVVRSRICTAVAVPAAAWRAWSRWARTPGMSAARARAAYRPLLAMGRSPASQAAGGCRQDQVP